MCEYSHTHTVQPCVTNEKDSIMDITNHHQPTTNTNEESNIMPTTICPICNDDYQAYGATPAVYEGEHTFICVPCATTYTNIITPNTCPVCEEGWDNETIHITTSWVDPTEDAFVCAPCLKENSMTSKDSYDPSEEKEGFRMTYTSADNRGLINTHHTNELAAAHKSFDTTLHNLHTPKEDKVIYRQCYLCTVVMDVREMTQHGSNIFECPNHTKNEYGKGWDMDDFGDPRTNTHSDYNHTKENNMTENTFNETELLDMLDETRVLPIDHMIDRFISYGMIWYSTGQHLSEMDNLSIRDWLGDFLTHTCQNMIGDGEVCGADACEGPYNGRHIIGVCMDCLEGMDHRGPLNVWHQDNIIPLGTSNRGDWTFNVDEMIEHIDRGHTGDMLSNEKAKEITDAFNLIPEEYRSSCKHIFVQLVGGKPAELTYGDLDEAREVFRVLRKYHVTAHAAYTQKRGANNLVIKINGHQVKFVDWYHAF